MATAEIFSARLRELCKTAPSISQVARDLEINRQQFARYLNGTTMPRENVIRQIGEYFNVDPGQLFQDAPKQQSPQSASNNAMLSVLSAALSDPIMPHELTPGFYMQYKQAFSIPNKIIFSLAQVREVNGVYYYKRRTSSKLVESLPGTTVTHGCEGVFMKQAGILIMIDVGSRTRDLAFHAFRMGSMFDSNIKPGLHMTPGRQGSVGPRAARLVLQKLPEGQSVLSVARQQRLMTLEEAPEVIRIHLEEPEYSLPGVFGLI